MIRYPVLYEHKTKTNLHFFVILEMHCLLTCATYILPILLGCKNKPFNILNKQAESTHMQIHGNEMKVSTSTVTCIFNEKSLYTMSIVYCVCYKLRLFTMEISQTVILY